jgi:hypothetical protein
MDKSKSAANPPPKGSATALPADPRAAKERTQETVSEQNPAGFKNDPDDPSNPNEAIERSRRKLRPSPLSPPPDEKK